MSMPGHVRPDEELVSPPPGLGAVERLRLITHRLRAPGGCPWDAEQSHQSLVPNLLEEAYEVLDAIRREDYDHLREELGDLLLQVVFHSELAEEAGRFDLERVATEICEKLVRRHPHVFADSEVNDTESVLRQWDAIKREEKGTAKEGMLHGVGDGLPALLRAAKLQKKAAKVGFDWEDAAGAMEKLREEIGEVEAELAMGTDAAHNPALERELGDLLFSAVNVVRKAGGDPEAALAAANQRFVERFHAMERALRADGLDPAAATITQMEERWQAAKF